MKSTETHKGCCVKSFSSSEVLSYVNSARLGLLTAYPMFYPLLLTVKFVVKEDEEHLMSVTEDGTIFVSPKILDRPTDEVSWILLHELLHILYNHFGRGKGFVPDVWELAAELEINDFVPYPPLKRPFGVLIPEEVGLPSGKTAEWYYHQLVINQKLTERVKRRRQELFNPCGGVERSASDEKILLEMSVEEVISALKTVKDIGNLPKTLCELIIKGKRETSLITYLSELENFIHSSLSGRYRWKFNLPSRRFYGEIKPPKVILSSPTVAVVLDISSSMSHKEISSSLQTIRGLVSSYQGEVVIYVANVDIVKEISVDDDVIPAGGGTSMRQSIISLTQNGDYQAVIVFTDGYTDYPEPHEVNFTPILWVLTSPNDEFRPPWGKTVTLPNEEV